MYSKVKIHKTEYFEKYLLISNNNTLLVGIFVRDILIFLNRKLSVDIVKEKINAKHSIQLNIQDIIEVKEKLDIFITKKDKSSLKKIIKLLNPNNIHIPSFSLKIFQKNIFYTIFFTSLFLNSILYFKLPSYNHKSISENLIIYTIVIIILFIHEIGHSIAAKKYKIQVSEIGFGLYYIFPVFYINLNEAWKLKIEKRNIINLSGIYFQLIIGLLLIIISFFQKDNYIFSSIFRINFYIILLNLNPFLKFDGYWIVSDLLKENNLLKTSNNLIKQKILKTTNYRIIIYTLFRISFIVFLIISVIKKITAIIFKYSNNLELTFSDYLFSFIIIFYIFKILITKIKNLSQYEFNR